MAPSLPVPVIYIKRECDDRERKDEKKKQFAKEAVLLTFQ
jgi:hypothetical protein